MWWTRNLLWTIWTKCQFPTSTNTNKRQQTLRFVVCDEHTSHSSNIILRNNVYFSKVDLTLESCFEDLKIAYSRSLRWISHKPKRPPSFYVRRMRHTLTCIREFPLSLPPSDSKPWNYLTYVVRRYNAWRWWGWWWNGETFWKGKGTWTTTPLFASALEAKGRGTFNIPCSPPTRPPLITTTSSRSRSGSSSTTTSVASDPALPLDASPNPPSPNAFISDVSLWAYIFSRALNLHPIPPFVSTLILGPPPDTFWSPGRPINGPMDLGDAHVLIARLHGPCPLHNLTPTRLKFDRESYH